MPQLLTQSRPYARSCLAVATAAKAQPEWAAALEALAAVASAPEVARLPSLPGVSDAQLAELVLETAKKVCPLPEGADNLVALLVENRRLALLPDIASQYRRLWQEQARKVPVEIDAAFELSEEQLASIGAALKKRLGVEAVIEVSIKPELGAGAVVRIGDDVIDASLRSRLASFGRAVAYG